MSFMEFIREQGVVGLAVGFILGGAVSKVVSSLVEDIVNPVIGILLGATDNLSSLFLTVGDTQIMYGHFLTVFIDFVVVAAVVFFIFKGLRLEGLDKKN